MKKIIAIFCCCGILLSCIPTQAAELEENEFDTVQEITDSPENENSNSVQNELENQNKQDDGNLENQSAEIGAETEDAVVEEKLDEVREPVIVQETEGKTEDLGNENDEIITEPSESPKSLTEKDNYSEEELKSGFIVEEGAVYYYENGEKYTGEKKIDGKWYYFNPNNNGKVTIGWQELTEKTGNKKTVYSGNDGVMCYGEKKISGKWYYFNTVTGKMATGWQKLTEKTGNKKTVYYGSNGAMCYGEKKISGKWYYFNTVTGKVATGWQKLTEKTGNKKTVYYGSNGAMCYGEKKISGKWYYFNTVTGKMATGWYNLPGKRVYYGSDGAMRYGWQTIGGVRYYFNKVTGALEQTNAMAKKAQSYSSSTKWLILVDTKSNHVGIYNGRKNNWIEKKYWSCTTGASATPTVKGSFTVKSKGLAFGSGYTCWYYTQFYGNYLFHSVLYNPGSKTSIQDGRLGINASHGCVRLSLSNAKWIYDNIPRGTKVVIY